MSNKMPETLSSLLCSAGKDSHNVVLRSCSLGRDCASPFLRKVGKNTQPSAGTRKIPCATPGSVQPAAVSAIKKLIETRLGARRCPGRMQKNQKTEFCGAVSHIYFEDLPSRKELNRHISKLWPHQILTVWALPELNGDNSTSFMLLIQGYKYRLVLFSVISKYGEIDKLFMAKDNILNSVPLDLLQCLPLSCHLSLIQLNRPIYQLLL